MTTRGLSGEGEDGVGRSCGEMDLTVRVADDSEDWLSIWGSGSVGGVLSDCDLERRVGP